MTTHKEMVRDAAWRFLEQTGKVPSTRDIREQIDGGSLRDIANELKAWQAALSKFVKTHRHQPGIPDEITRLMNSVWAKAVMEARQSAKKEYLDRRTDLEQKEEKIKRELASLKADNMKLSNEEKQAKKKLKVAQDAINECERYKTSAEHRRDLLEMLMEERDREIERLKKEMDKMSSRYESRINGFENKVDGFIATTERQRRENSSLHHRLGVVEGERGRCLEMIHELKAKIETVEDDLRQADAYICHLEEIVGEYQIQVNEE